jgi:hypothetical protein
MAAGYGAFAPIMNLARRAKQAGTDLFDGDTIKRMLGMPVDTPEGGQPLGQPDPAWHRQMVEQANQSFRDKAAADAAAVQQAKKPMRKLPARVGTGAGAGSQ